MTYPGLVQGRFTIPASTTISVTTNGGGPTSVTITAGDYYAYEFADTLESILDTQRPVTGGNWSVSISATTGLYTIAVDVGTFSITWTSTTFRDLLGYSSTITTQTSVTAGSVARGIWIPDCPFNVDGDLTRAPLATDHRATEGPTGVTFALVGNTKYRYRNLRWSHVAQTNVWGTYGTWEQFLKDVHLGQGHSYFVPSSKIKVHYGSDVTATRLGGTTGNYGWYMKGISSIEPVKVNENWGGLWRVAIPEIVSDGS